MYLEVEKQIVDVTEMIQAFGAFGLAMTCLAVGFGIFGNHRSYVPLALGIVAAACFIMAGVVECVGILAGLPVGVVANG